MYKLTCIHPTNQLKYTITNYKRHILEDLLYKKCFKKTNTVETYIE